MKARRRSQRMYLLGDISCCCVAVISAVWLRGLSAKILPVQLLAFCAITSLTVVTISVVCGSYKCLWQHFGFSEIFRQLFISFLSAVILCIIGFAAETMIADQKIFIYTIKELIICFGIQFGLCAGVRAFRRCYSWYSAKIKNKGADTKRVVVVGAGAAGAMVVKRFCENSHGMLPVAVVDDDEGKIGTLISGVEVQGKISELERIIEEKKACTVVIAIPTAGAPLLNKIYESCKHTGAAVKIFSSIMDVEHFYFNPTAERLRDISIDDLLFRDCVNSDKLAAADYVKGETVLVTGGAGSIGSEICRQVLLAGCRRVIVFDINENGLFELGEELASEFDSSRYELCIGTIRDDRRLERVFSKFQPAYVFHAAAHKHVPLMEGNPAEAIKNNIFGTLLVMSACQKYDVKKFVLISTDKAVHPANIMGATKRVAELLTQSMNGSCVMTAVRFGNVLGSNGSVIPTFKRQIEAGGPVTVTHRNITRYFMTIPEAVSLVLCAGALARGGEIFVLDMGKPIKIYDLAADMIRMSGLRLGEDIDIEITGLRPGEKMFEELSLAEEDIVKTLNEKIFMVYGAPRSIDKLQARLEGLKKMIRLDSPPASLYAEVFSIIEDDTAADKEVNGARAPSRVLAGNLAVDTK